MTPIRKLRVVEAEPSLAALTFEFRKALSAAAGKHIGDDYRAEIMRRFDNSCHVRGDRAPAITLPRNWRAPR